MSLNDIDKRFSQIALSRPELIDALISSGIIIDKVINKTLKQTLEYYKKHKIVPIKTLKSILPEEYKDLFDSQDIVEADCDAFHQTLHEYTFQLFQSKILTDIEKYNSLEEFVEEHSETVHSIPQPSEDVVKVCGASMVHQLVKRRNEAIDAGIPTGFENIDVILKGGGWMRKNLYCIMGLSGTGKSIFLTNFTGRLHIAGRRVLHITTEMDVPETAERVFQSMMEQKSFEAAAVKYQGMMQLSPPDLYFLKVGPNECSTTNIVEHIEKKMDGLPDVIVIDYADELRPSEKTISDYEKYQVIYSDLKRLAEKFNCPVITATQTNRQAAGKEGGTEALVGSWTIGDSWNKVKPLTFLAGIVQEPMDYKIGFIHLQINKNRSGTSIGRLAFTINYETWRIADTTEVVYRAALDLAGESKSDDTNNAAKRHQRNNNRNKDFKETSKNQFENELNRMEKVLWKKD